MSRTRTTRIVAPRAGAAPRTTQRPRQRQGEGTMPDTRTDTAPPSQDWRVIHTYTRAEAIADGVLVDVTPHRQGSRIQGPDGGHRLGLRRVHRVDRKRRQAVPDLPGPGRPPLGRPVPRRRQGPLPPRQAPEPPPVPDPRRAQARPPPPAPPHPQARHRPGRRRRARRHAHAAQRGLATPPKDARVQPPLRNPDAQPRSSWPPPGGTGEDVMRIARPSPADLERWARAAARQRRRDERVAAGALRRARGSAKAAGRRAPRRSRRVPGGGRQAHDQLPRRQPRGMARGRAPRPRRGSARSRRRLVKVKRGARAVEAAALKAIERARQSRPPAPRRVQRVAWRSQARARGSVPPRPQPHPVEAPGVRPQHRRDRVLQALSRHRPRQPRARLRTPTAPPSRSPAAPPGPIRPPERPMRATTNARQPNPQRRPEPENEPQRPPRKP